MFVCFHMNGMDDSSSSKYASEQNCFVVSSENGNVRFSSAKPDIEEQQAKHTCSSAWLSILCRETALSKVVGPEKLWPPGYDCFPIWKHEALRAGSPAADSVSECVPHSFIKPWSGDSTEFGLISLLWLDCSSVYNLWHSFAYLG